MPCNKITMKQKAFAKKAVELKNSTEAAMQTYSCKNRNSAANIASRLHRNPKVMREIELALAKANVTEDTVADTLGEAMKAKVVTILEGQATESNVPDYQIRTKAAVEVAKLLDAYPAQRTESRTLNIDLELEKMPPKALAHLLRELAQQIYGESNSQEKLGTGAGGNENRQAPESQK